MPCLRHAAARRRKPSHAPGAAPGKLRMIIHDYMSKNLKTLWTVCLSLALLPLSAQEKPDTVYTFRFVPDRDMFYVPYHGNASELARLEDCVERYREEILAGKMPLYIDGYSSARRDEAANLALAKTRSNRVKSELIVRRQLAESCFITRNHAGGGDCVTVRLAIPAPQAATPGAASPRKPAAGLQQAGQQAEARQPEQARPAAGQAGADSLAAAQPITGAPAAEPPAAAKPAPSWYAGISAGMPFGTSAMGSFGAGGATPGWSAGIYGGCRFSPVLSLELQAAWGRLALNRRDCCPDYWMGADGCRYEAAVAGMDGWYMSALRSRTFTQRYAVQLNVNLLGFFPATRDSRWSLALSPHIAAIGTQSDFRLTDGNAGILHVATRWHLGAGSNVQDAYAFPAGLQLGIYTGMAYLTGKPLDGTPEHLHKANYIWETGLKLGWSFGSKGKEDRR